MRRFRASFSEIDSHLCDNHGLAFRVNDPPWLGGQVHWGCDIDIGGRPLAGKFHPGSPVSDRTVPAAWILLPMALRGISAKKRGWNQSRSLDGVTPSQRPIPNSEF
jgi:hypothetical protein